MKTFCWPVGACYERKTVLAFSVAIVLPGCVKTTPIAQFHTAQGPGTTGFSKTFLKSPVSKWRIVGVKTRTKAFLFEEIVINIPLENLFKLSKERMQYFCHVLKLNFRSRQSASASNCSMRGRSSQT